MSLPRFYCQKIYSTSSYQIVLSDSQIQHKRTFKYKTALKRNKQNNFKNSRGRDSCQGSPKKKNLLSVFGQGHHLMISKDAMLPVTALLYREAALT